MSRTGEFDWGVHLSHEARVSVAEEAMERGSLAGRVHHVPFVRRDWSNPAPPAQHAEVHDYLHGVLIGAGMQPDLAKRIRVQPKDWDARGAQAMTDGLNKVGLAGEHVSEMTLLHEAAHVLHGTSEGTGHGPDFINTLHGLYERHLGPEAASTFRRIVEPPT